MKSLLSLPVLVAFGLFSSPARALPAASMQLFRVDGNGVKPLPAVSAILESAKAASASRSSAQASAQLAPASPDSTAAGSASRLDSGSQDSPGLVTPPSFQAAAQAQQPVSGAPMAEAQLLAQASNPDIGPAAALTTLSQDFTGPLPPNLSGNIRLVNVAEDGTLGSVVEEIPFTSSNVSFSPDRRRLIVTPRTPIAPGQSVMMQLPSRSLEGVRFIYPNHLVSTPCVFKAAAVSTLPAAGAPAAAAAGAAAAAPAAAAAAAASFPVWAVVAGVIVVGVGVAAAAGAFSSGGGGGGTNPSSQ